MTTQHARTKLRKDKVAVYCFICDYMAQSVSFPIQEKLGVLKRKIQNGYISPSGNSKLVFGVNLFIFDYEYYVSMYEAVNGTLS